MNKRIDEAIEALTKVLQEELSDRSVHVEISINCEGPVMNVQTRSPESLKRDGISMRNIKGKFITQ